MRFKLNSFGGVALMALLLLLCAAEPPPVPEPPPPAERNFTLRGAGLNIRPGRETIYLRFDGGVSVSGEDFSLSAQSVEVDVATKTAIGGGLKLPQESVQPERVSAEPGAAMADMAREMELPRANLTASAIQRVGAAGGVEIKTPDLTLSTAELVSTDGGRSWAANNRSTITHQAKGEERYSLQADTLLYDTISQRAVARGNISGSFAKPGEQELQVSAQHCEFDIAAGTLVASGGLQIRYGNTLLTSGSLSADLDSSQLSATDGPQLTDSEQGLTLDAQRIDAELNSRQVTATGGVTVVSERRELTLRCAEVRVDLEKRSLVAEGEPVLTYKDSTYSGSRISVTEVDGKTVVEVEGPQSARINLDTLPQTDDLP